MTKKIALIGSAPSSVALGPYDDPSWQIWGCSPGARPHVKRVDMWFELHLYEPQQPWFSQEYVDFMSKLAVPVMMLEPVPGIPGSVAYPKQEILDRYGVEGVWFFTSSLAWMIALAIESGADEIGLFGVDMSAAEELYTNQRAGCQYFIGKALARGIKVTVPPQSDLMRPTPLYGYCELDGMHQKLLARKAELDHRIAMASNAFESARNDLLYLRGAAEDVNYTRQTWVADRQVMDILKLAGASEIAAPLPPAHTCAQETPHPSPTPAGEGAPAPVGEGVARAAEPAFNAGEEQLEIPAVTWATTAPPNFINGAIG